MFIFAVIGLFDVLAVIIILYARRHFKLAVEKYEFEYDASVLEIADYTVLVSGLPKNISPSEADNALLECDPGTLAGASLCCLCFRISLEAHWGFCVRSMPINCGVSRCAVTDEQSINLFTELHKLAIHSDSLLRRSLHMV